MKFERLQKLADEMFLVEEGALVERYDLDKLRPQELHPLVLAYVGDAYFHLFIRRRILAFTRVNIGLLHKFTSQMVSAVYQNKAYRQIEGSLTEREKAIYRRARNTKSHAPRSASVAEYHSSTGFEAVLGTLYLEGEKERLDAICEEAFQAIVKEIVAEREQAE